MIAKKTILGIVVATLLVAGRSSAQILSYTGGTYTQDFNSLPTTGTGVAFSLPGFFAVDGATPITTITANTGSGSNGLFSAGPAGTGSADRALQLGNVNTHNYSFGLGMTNNTGVTLGGVTISYTGEQWFKGATAAAVNTTLGFSYSTNSTNLADGTFTAVNALSFVSPQQTGTAANGNALSGNLAANQTLFSNISFTVAGGWAPGATLFIRWNDPAGQLNGTGTGFPRDNGLAVDDLSLTGFVVPEPSAWVTVLGGMMMLAVMIRWRRVVG